MIISVCHVVSLICETVIFNNIKYITLKKIFENSLSNNIRLTKNDYVHKMLYL